jgi:hypothetical protein
MLSLLSLLEFGTHSCSSCSAARSCLNRARACWISSRPSGVTRFGCAEIIRSGKLSKVSSVSLTKALLTGRPLPSKPCMKRIPAPPRKMPTWHARTWHARIRDNQAYAAGSRQGSHQDRAGHEIGSTPRILLAREPDEERKLLPIRRSWPLSRASRFFRAIAATCAASRGVDRGDIGANWAQDSPSCRCDWSNRVAGKRFYDLFCSTTEKDIKADRVPSDIGT